MISAEPRLASAVPADPLPPMPLRQVQRAGRVFGAKAIPWAFFATMAPLAQARATPVGPMPSQGLHPIDWAVVLVFVAAMLALGAYYSRRQSDNQEYFIAANRPIRPIFVGISLYAALLSTISYLGKPGEMINKGPVLLLSQILSIPLAYVIVTRWLLPRIMQERVTSAYELLERRLGLVGRVVGTILFLSLRIVWMGLLIYLAAVAVTVVVQVDEKHLGLVAAAIGIVPILYASMGGLRTIVITEVVQFALLLTGAIATIIIISIHCGGFSWWPTTWAPEWDAQPVFSLDPYVRVTLVSGLVNMLLWRVATAGGDQMAIQRFMATGDLAAARRSYAVTSIATVVVTAILAVLGLALLGYFQRFPQLLGGGLTIKADGDRLFPYFIAHLLPVGLKGLVVAAVMAGPMSSIGAGVNAITAVVSKDYIDRFGVKFRSARRQTLLTKLMALTIGGLVVLASIGIKGVPGNFMEVTNKTAALESTPIFALFFLALFVPFATPLGAVIGTAYGLATCVLVAFWDLISGRPAISFQYIGLLGFLVNIGVGCLVSRYGPRREDLRSSINAGAVGLFILAAGITLLIGFARR